MREYHEVVLENQLDDEINIYLGDWADENILGGPKVTVGTSHVVFQGEHPDDARSGWLRGIEAIDRLLRTMEEKYLEKFGDRADQQELDG